MTVWYCFECVSSRTRPHLEARAVECAATGSTEGERRSMDEDKDKDKRQAVAAVGELIDQDVRVEVSNEWIDCVANDLAPSRSIGVDDRGLRSPLDCTVRLRLIDACVVQILDGRVIYGRLHCLDKQGNILLQESRLTKGGWVTTLSGDGDDDDRGWK